MIRKIRTLSLMTQRLIFVGSFAFAILFQVLIDSKSFLQYDSVDFWTELSVAWFGYWGITLIVVWGISNYRSSK
jgi:hypothetical protein